MTEKPADLFWQGCAQGEIRYQTGPEGHVQSYPRDFCERTGSAELTWHRSKGYGTVEARTVVGRAPGPEFEAIVPYVLVLIRMDEGFTLMAHGAPDLAIGVRVKAAFRKLGHRHLPFFERWTAL